VVLGGWGMEPMTWIDSEDRGQLLEDGAVLVVVGPCSAAYSGSTSANRSRRLNAVDDGPTM
jgi:hypothetical protein